MSRRTQTKARLIAGLSGASLIIALSASCGGGSDAVTGSGNPNNTVASISLSDSAITVEMGFLRELSVTAKSSTGATLQGVAIAWSSDNPAVAQIVDGNVTPFSVGSARITASAGGRSASAVVTVIPTVVISVQLSRTKMTLPPGRIGQLTATPLDAAGRPIVGRAVAFKSSDSSIVSVGATGILTAKEEGTAAITASSDDRSSQALILVTPPTQISIAANGSNPIGFPSPSGVAITLRDDDDSLTTAVASGSLVTLSGQILLNDSVQLVAQAGGSAYWPSRMTLSRFSVPTSVPIVFIPRTVTFATGPFAGTAIETSMDAATAPCSSAFGNQCSNGFYGHASRTGVTAWASLPIPVTLNGFSSTDSASLWDSLHALEAALGRQFFAPSTAQSGSGIAVVLQPRPANTPAGSTGFTTWAWDGQNRMTNAQIWFATSTPSQSLVQHEFLHALGFWHTCSWPSVMGGYGCSQLNLTATDAAYVKLAYAVFAAEIPLRLATGEMPCGYMGVWNATLFSQPNVLCGGNNLRTDDLVRRSASAQ